MATLQKPKPKANRTSRQQASTTTITTTEDSNRSNDERITTSTPSGDTNELEQLMLEPVSYDHLCTTTTTTTTTTSTTSIKQDHVDDLSPELVQSLQSVKQVCLVALDSLLRQMVNTIPSTTKAERRLSDSSVHEQAGHYSLLNSIVQSTNRLSSTPSSCQHQHQMKRSDSSPAVATLSIVQQVLTSHQTWLLDSSTDYNMCCSLAALLHHLYRLLELGQSSSEASFLDATPPTSPISPTSSIYSQLRESMSTFQKEKASSNSSSTTTTTTTSKKSQQVQDEMTILWDELDQLMTSITCLAAQERPVIESAPPPAYYDIVTSFDTPPPSSSSLDATTPTTGEKKDPTPPDYVHQNQQQNEKAAYDLDQLLTAIDQLSSVSPRLNNQRVDMTERQAKELAAATVGRTIERLSRGRMEEQRASLSKSSDTMLQGLMNQIQRSSLRSLDNQRVCMNPRLKKKINAAAIHGLLDRNDRGRLASQDWTSPEQQMIDDMTTMTDMLTKVMNRPKYSQQRYSLSALKEREFFFNHLLQKVDRMEGRRMSNQDAEWTRTTTTRTKKQPLDVEDELGYLFDNIHRSKSQLDNQRATFSTAATSPLILSTASI